MTVTVFLGPSLPLSEAGAILAGDYRPPARQGDLYRLVKQRRPAAIAIVDGYFQEAPSVWHKEILWALDQGVPVYGAASMGALRAAELDRYGMVGIGKVYQAYRCGTYAPYQSEPFEDDDEVAVIHGPAELGFPSLSDAMVDLRETFAAAAQAGIIGTGLRDALVAAFKRRFYRERSFGLVQEVLAELCADQQVAEGLLAWLPERRIYQKAADARALLMALAEQKPELPAERENFTFERTTLWAQFVEQADDRFSVSGDERRVLEELRLDAGLYRSLREAAVLRHQVVLADLLPPSDVEAKRRALDRLRRRHGLWTRQALQAWAGDCDLDRVGLDRLLEFEAGLDSCAEAAGPGLDTALLDVLRNAGHYPALAARARDKQQRLQAAGHIGTASSALSSEALLDWYFESRLAQAVPGDAVGYATELGFGEFDEFLAAVALERAYLAVCSPGEATGPESSGKRESQA